MILGVLCRAPRGAAPSLSVPCDPEPWVPPKSEMVEGLTAAVPGLVRTSRRIHPRMESPPKAFPAAGSPPMGMRTCHSPHTLEGQLLIPCQHILPVSRGTLTPWVISCVNALSLITRCFNVVN